MTLLLWTIAILLVAIGLIGAVVPALPGAALVFAGLVLAAWAEGFERVGWSTVALLGALTVLVYLVDFLAGIYGVSRVGASRRAVYGAALGAVIGIFFGLPGLVLGPFLGAVAGELTVRRNLGVAGRAGLGAWLGLMLGTVAKVALLFAMLGIFGVALLY